MCFQCCITLSSAKAALQGAALRRKMPTSIDHEQGWKGRLNSCLRGQPAVRLPGGWSTSSSSVEREGMGTSITQCLQPWGEGAVPPLALQSRLHQQSAGALNHKNTQLRRIQKAHPNCTPASGQEQTPELLLTHGLTSQWKPAAAETWLLPWWSCQCLTSYRVLITVESRFFLLWRKPP